MRGWKFCVGFYAREGFGTRREIFSREAAYGDGRFKSFYVESRKSDQEATGYSRWFERLLAELGIEIWMGDPAEIKAKRVKKAEDRSQ